MFRTETSSAELSQSVDGIDWRHFWLKNVMIDSGKLAPTKIARRELRSVAAFAKTSSHESSSRPALS
jgi:hypothetical protein